MDPSRPQSRCEGEGQGPLSTCRGTRCSRPARSGGDGLHVRAQRHAAAYQRHGEASPGVPGGSQAEGRRIGPRRPIGRDGGRCGGLREMSDPTLIADATVEARRFLARVKPRTLRTESGKIITTGDIAEALVRRAALESAVLPGKRKQCVDCRGPFAQGKVGIRCRSCTRKRAAARLVCPHCAGPKNGRSAVCRGCPGRPRATVLCACGAPGSKVSGRCRSCACKAREAAKTPEQKRAHSDRARKQLTPEERRRLSSAGGRASAAAVTPEERRARGQRVASVAAAKPAAVRSEATSKGWQTRRAKKAPAPV